MADTPDKHIKLILRTLPSGQAATVMVKKSTAEFLGWTQHFETYPQWVRRRIAEGGPGFPAYRKNDPRAQGGIPLRLGRGKNPSRNEAGLTHTFRVGSKVSTADLAELAAMTEVPFEWMERRCGTRESRDWWFQRYAAIP